MGNDPHPYVTVQVASTGYVAVLIVMTPNGFAQVSERGDEHGDFVEAKREAVQMAKRHGCLYLVPTGA